MYDSFWQSSYDNITRQQSVDYGRVRGKSRFSRDGRPYEYAIQLPTWQKGPFAVLCREPHLFTTAFIGTDSWQENNAKQLNSELIE